MAYIGKSPIIGNFVKLDAITAVNGQAAYTMQNGGSNFTDYESVNQFIVSLNGTIQAPTDSFTVSGSTLTFASNLSTGDVIDFVMCFGNSLSAGTPTDATVSTAKIVDDAVTAAKINNDIISGSTELAETPADTDEFLVSDAGTLKRVDYSHIKGGGITVADNWRLTSDVSTDTGVLTNWEQNDTAGAGQIGTSMSFSSGAFTFPSTGIYLVTFNAIITEGSAADNLLQIDGYFNSTRVMQIFLHVNNNSDMSTGSNQVILDVDDVSKTFYTAYVNVTAGASLRGTSDTNHTSLTFIRLGDT